MGLANYFQKKPVAGKSMPTIPAGMMQAQVMPNNYWDGTGGYDQSGGGNMDPGLSYAGGSNTFDESAGGGGGPLWSGGAPVTDGSYATGPLLGGGDTSGQYDWGGQQPVGNFMEGPLPQYDLGGEVVSGIGDAVTGGGTSGLPDWLQQAIGGVSSGVNMAALAPSLAAAYSQWQDSDKYMTETEKYAKEANPFGDQRGQYADALSKLQADPSSIENSAAYQFRLNQGLNTLGPQQAAKGGGYGNEQRAMMDYASGLASTEYDNEAKRLANLAGAQFGPETAAQLRMKGLDASVASKNAALGSLMFPFAPGTKNTTVNNNNGGGSNGGGSNGSGGALGNGLKAVTGLGTGGAALAGAAQKVIDQNGGMAAVSALARQGNPEAIKLLTQVSGGTATDQNILDLNNGGTPGFGTGDTEMPYDTGDYSGFNMGGDPLTSGGEYGTGEFDFNNFDPGSIFDGGIIPSWGF